MSKKKYNPEVDLVKFFFSVIIMLFHTIKIDVIAAGQHILPFGFTAVEFFFMVSGYLMAKSSLKYSTTETGKSTFDFVFRKIKSIYPYFFFSFIVAFFGRQIILFNENSQTIVGFCKDALASVSEALLIMKAGIDFGKSYNGPTWYIGAMIFAMAIIFPILLKHRDWFLNIGSIVVAIFMYALAFQEKHTLNYLDWSGWTTMAIIRAIGGISLGCFVYALVERVYKNNISLKKTGKVLLWLFEMALFALILLIMQFEGKNKFDFITVIISLVLCFIIFSGLTGVQNILPSKFCSFLGKYSLLLYLNHRVVTRIINHYMPNLNYTQALLTFIALTIILSVVSDIVVTTHQKFSGKFMPKIKSLIFE